MSISELEAYIARIVVARRGPSWLFATVEWAIERLAAEQYQAQLQSASHGIVRARGRALQRYIEALEEWRFLVDLESDLNVARTVGAPSVISLIYKTEFANALAPVFITSIVEPALDKRALLPIADSYAAYASAVDPYWKDEISAALKDLELSSASKSGPLVTRLAVLSTIPVSAMIQDPRPATSLFADYREAERQVVINEFGRERVESAMTVAIADSARLAIVPQLRDEVDRNQGLLEGRTRFDIPGLIRNRTELAAGYRTDPKFLLAEVQKAERIPYLLGAFLALNLMDQNWDISYEIAEGIQLRSGSRQIQPFTLVEQLEAKAISEAEFLDAVK